MVFSLRRALARVARVARLFLLSRDQRTCLRRAHRLGLFDPVFYRGAYPNLHMLHRIFALRHYLVFGEAQGYRPNAEFSPQAYLTHNPDVAAQGLSPFAHWVTIGHLEDRVIRDLPTPDTVHATGVPPLPRDWGGDRPKARFAVAVHIYYPEVWAEFSERLSGLDLDFDLYVTLTHRGDETQALAKSIRTDFPQALVHLMANRGRDILPFVSLINAGLLDGYEAVCKLHSKKSPHRKDGDTWRRHLMDGVLPLGGVSTVLDQFLDNRCAAIWVADGQLYTGKSWWGSNFAATRDLLRRVEVDIDEGDLHFPAGSIYWLKPLMIGMLKSLHLDAQDFDAEHGQLDGTLAHAIERALGYLAQAAGQSVVQSSELAKPAPASPQRPRFVSAFYLPQFHPVPENDRWWGKGFTEWRGVVQAQSRYAGHNQPFLPRDLGFYDLRLTEVLGRQTALARSAGIDAFCVYHYWFDGRRMLQAPLDRLLRRADVDFPFYLCWANESWRRNWDGLSGEILIEQSYAEGFEDQLVQDSLPYLRDPRYARPDGHRPRFVIYRPCDMPTPERSIARMRQAWRRAGIGEVEIGAVRFHLTDQAEVADDLVDFWVEMPPHGLVEGDDYLVGGPGGNRLGRDLDPAFDGLIYDYTAVIDRSLSQAYRRQLPANTICGAMPGWDNSARRGPQAHIAHGANPARFAHWIDQILDHRIAGSYGQELFLNAWNEWAEKAVLEPSEVYGDLMLSVLRDRIGPRDITRLSDAA
jgi:lipopolysaccharide biosynthesis protein